MSTQSQKIFLTSKTFWKKSLRMIVFVQKKPIIVFGRTFEMQDRFMGEEKNQLKY